MPSEQNRVGGAMNELEQLRQEAEHLKNAIREGRKAACDTSLAQVDKTFSKVTPASNQTIPQNTRSW